MKLSNTYGSLLLNLKKVISSTVPAATVSPCVIILIHLIFKLYYNVLNMNKLLSQIPSPIWERWWVRKRFICLLLLLSMSYLMPCHVIKCPIKFCFLTVIRN